MEQFEKLTGLLRALKVEASSWKFQNWLIQKIDGTAELF
jgi:hypothetical protein